MLNVRELGRFGAETVPTRLVLNRALSGPGFIRVPAPSRPKECADWIVLRTAFGVHENGAKPPDLIKPSLTIRIRRILSVENNPNARMLSVYSSHIR